MEQNGTVKLIKKSAWCYLCMAVEGMTFYSNLSYHFPSRKLHLILSTLYSCRQTNMQMTCELLQKTLILLKMMIPHNISDFD